MENMNYINYFLCFNVKLYIVISKNSFVEIKIIIVNLI